MKAPSPHGRGGSQIRFRIAPDLLDRIQQDAASGGRTMNAEIVRLIEKGLEPVKSVEASAKPFDPWRFVNDELASAIGPLFACVAVEVLRTSLPPLVSIGRLGASSSGRLQDGVRGAGSLRTSNSRQDETGMPPPVKNWVARFLEECCEIDTQAETHSVAFREAYTRWARVREAPVPLPSSLGRYVTNLGVRKRKTGGQSIYIGLRLRSASPSAAAKKVV